jgi:flavin reductase (DIM6/NTAB) family NADH-FMN oxidoreductase RutF
LILLTYRNFLFPDQYQNILIDFIPAEMIRSPLLGKATINLECELFKEVEAGDHIVFMGKVLVTYVNKEKKVLLNMKKVDGKRVFEEF